MGASDGQTLNGWVPEKVPRVAEKILGGEKVKSRLSEVWLWSTIIRMHFRSAWMENAKLRWKSRRVWFSRKIRKSLAAASKSQAKPDVRNLKLDLHYITTNSETTTFTIVVKGNIISFSSWSTFKIFFGKSGPSISFSQIPWEGSPCYSPPSTSFSTENSYWWIMKKRFQWRYLIMKRPENLQKRCTFPFIQKDGSFEWSNPQSIVKRPYYEKFDLFRHSLGLAFVRQRLTINVVRWLS